jgi:RNA polymerase sigma factor (sigma-70 family)
VAAQESPAHPAGEAFVGEFDRAAEAGDSLRRRRRLRRGTRASGTEVERRIRRIDAVEPGRDDLSELAAAARRGDGSARVRVAERCLPLVAAQARRYAGRDLEAADLVQEGILGVLRALERWEPSRGVPFPAYAAWWVRQAMQQAVAEQSRAVRLPTHVLWDIHRLRETRERRTTAEGKEPSARELVAELGWTPRRLDDVVRAEQPALSLDAPFAGDQGEVDSLGDLVADPLSAEAYDAVLSQVTGASVRALLSTLTQRERQVLGWRFGLDGPELSLRQIGRRLGMSAERVRQIEERALVKLRMAALPDART